MVVYNDFDRRRQLMPYAPCQKDCETTAQGHCHPNKWNQQKKGCYEGDGPIPSFVVEFSCRVGYVPTKQRFQIVASNADAALEEAWALARQRNKLDIVVLGGLGERWFLAVDLFDKSNCHYAVKANSSEQCANIMSLKGIAKRSICFAVRITPEA